MADNFRETIESIFKGMDQFITTKTVIGDAVTVGDTVVIPLVDVTFGMAASGKTEERKKNEGGGMGGKISPSAVLLVQNGSTRLVNVRTQDSVTRIIDMMPDLMNRFVPGREKTEHEKQVDEAIRSANEKSEF